jgi:hypothetical protein
MIALLAVLTSGCGSGSTSVTRSLAASPQPTIGATPTALPADATAAYLRRCPTIVSEPLRTPPPSLRGAIRFDFNPDPAINSKRYTGIIAFVLLSAVPVDSEVLTIINQSGWPMTVDMADLMFIADTGLLHPMFAGGFPGNSGGQIQIENGDTLQLMMSGLYPAPGVRVTWLIGGTLGRAEVPLYLDVAFPPPLIATPTTNTASQRQC